MSRRRAIAFAAMTPLALLASSACSETRATSSTASQPSASAVPVPAASASAVAAALDAGPYEGPWIGAMIMQAPIFSDMEYPSDKKENKVLRLG
jgi:hypothetical protein